MRAKEMLEEIKNLRNEIYALELEERDHGGEDIRNRLTLSRVTLEGMCATLKIKLERIKTPIFRDILDMRYVQGFTWRKTADKLFFDQRWVVRLSKRAEKELEEVWDNA